MVFFSLRLKEFVLKRSKTYYCCIILQIITRSIFKTSNTIKRVCYFHLSLVGIPSILILLRTERVEGDGGGGAGGWMFALRTKSVERGESYLSTVPYLVVVQRVIVGCWVVGALLFTKVFL